MKRPYLDYNCIKCLLVRNLNIDVDINDDKKTSYIKDLMKIIIDAPNNTSAPEVVEKINLLQNEHDIHPFDCKKVKEYYNNLLLNYESLVWDNIIKSSDPLYCALSYAFIGNFIDFGANLGITDEKLIALIDDVKNVSFDSFEYKKFKKELSESGTITYLLDNCGEIVFDKLFIKYLMMEYPNLKINVIVRGRDVLNDVTLEDAQQVGLDKITTVLDNGIGVAGTILERINKDSLNAINKADLIISKGMGNFETLIGCGLNIYYVFMCKCEKFCSLFNTPLYSYMFLNEKRINL